MTRLNVRPGVHASTIDGVFTMRVDQPLPRAPVFYETGVVFVLQGSKQGFLGGEAFRYDPSHYLVLSNAMPFECITLPAGTGRSMLGLRVTPDMATIGELMTKLENEPPAGDALRRAVQAAPMEAPLAESVARLVEALESRRDADVLGKSAVREVLYRVLIGEHGQGLRTLARLNGKHARIGRTVARLRERFAEPVDVQQLAAEAAMGLSTFHECFRAVTQSTPVQYVKEIRLHKARELMAVEGLGVAEAARAVGYQSPSQFGRDFRKFFGQPPTGEVRLYRELHGLGATTPSQ